MSKKKGEPKLDFEKISKELGNIRQKQHMDQLSPALTDVYIKHSGYTDEKGVKRFKEEFNDKEAKGLANDLYDALGYHSHRRVFSMDKKTFGKLKEFKDANGTPYMDGVINHHYDITRKILEKTIDKHKTELDVGRLQQILQEPITHHANLLHQGLISKHGLDDPKHANSVKKAIDNIVGKYNLSKKKYDTSKLHSPQEILQTYSKLAQEHYKKD
ncbi:hypothetical protein HOC13_01615 [Candidatus Woesearchaeota archaeon]|jgi:hypothetical protein|nr:hypothetical protein [Candidatus Woesearchaeota archaeon]